MTYDEGLAQRVRDTVATRDGIVERKIFSSLGFFLGGNMAVAAHREGLIVRLGPDAEKAVEEPGVNPFKPGDSKPMTGWVMVDLDAVAEDDALSGWIDDGMDFAATLPPK
jgi:TfoX/Sxy family transcriptional regulator of competence genes